MATFEVTGPDGTRYQVTAPDDASDDQIMQYVQAQAKPKVPAAPQTGVGEAALIAAGRGMTQLGRGAQQAYYGLLGDTGAQDALAAKVAEENRLYKPLQEEHPIATALGEGAPVVMGGPLTMAAAGALEYGTPEEKAMRAGAGFVGGKLGQYGGQLLGRVLNPVRASNPAAMAESQALAAKYGVELTPAQATGSRALAGLEGTLSQLPGSAGVMSKTAQAQREAFNRGAMGALGESGTIGNDAALLARQNIGGRIEQAASGAKIPVDDALLRDLASVESKYTKNLTPDQKPIVRQYMDDILNQGPMFNGEAYQTWRSRIGARAASTSDSELKGALKGIQSALDNAFDRAAGPDAAKAMQTARGQYRNFKTLEPLIEKASMSSSNIPPAQVLNRALATKNTQGEMGGLAQLGQIMGKEYPNSGTVPRLFWQDLMINPGRIINPGYLLGATGVPYLTAKTMTSKPVKNYLTDGLLGISPETESLLKRLGAGSGGLLGLSLAP